MEVQRVQGCCKVNGILGLLFDEKAEILPLRLLTSCEYKYTKQCSFNNCPRYRIGTKVSFKISWDNLNKRM